MGIEKVKKMLLNFLSIFLPMFISKDIVMAQQQSLKLHSPAFQHEGEIPSKYTCRGEDVSLPLSWEGVPKGTKSFALIMEDPDAPAGTWVHWVIFNIPPDVKKLEENIRTLSAGAKEGINSWSKLGYRGPCPPHGEHRYFIRFWALDTILDLPKGATSRDVRNAIQEHILGSAEFMGKYGKKKQ